MPLVAVVCKKCGHCEDKLEGPRETWKCDDCGSLLFGGINAAPSVAPIYSDKPALCRSLDKVTRTF